MKCPLCSNTNQETLLSLNCGNIDGSSLYETVKIQSCNNCGHVFNLLTEEEMQGVLRYYQEEYSKNNIFSPNKTGDIPGSNNEQSINRYKFLYNTLSGFLKKDAMILDIGCASGGFLKYLKNNRYKNLYGLEFSKLYVEKAKEIKGLIIKEGSAEDLNFTEKFDFLIADQVVEHLFDPNKIFLQAKKVLKPGGMFCISVPNSCSYIDNYFFDFYWFLMREHIQHFDFKHLIFLASKWGFSFKSVNYSTMPMLSDEVLLPNMTVLLELTNDSTELGSDMALKDTIKKYIDISCESLARRSLEINELALSQNPLCIWGISREFLFLYTNTNLKRCNIIALIDDTTSKQTKTFMGMKIVSSSELKSLPADTNMLITAYAHKDILINKLKDLNFKGKVIP